MKIVHMCLSCFYIDNFGYQENYLPRQNMLDGHDVAIIASTETIEQIKLYYVKPQNYINEDGIPVKRIPYRKIPGRFFQRKLRSYPDVYGMLEQEKPDVILFHGAAAWELLTVARYKKNHPKVKFYVDSHEDSNNSGRSFLSKNILNGMLYRWILLKSLVYIDKILYYSLESKNFVHSVYGVPKEKLEFYPLGGIIVEDDEYFYNRKRIRSLLNITENEVLFLHTGKLDKKKRTVEILQAYASICSKKSRLIILGAMDPDTEKLLNSLIQADYRVQYLGWKTSNELQEYLCAADVYVQPGSQSATMQNAMCCRCALMLYPHLSHEPYLQGNGVYVTTREDMVDAFRYFTSNPDKIQAMQENSLMIAKRLLDYKVLAARLYL